MPESFLLSANQLFPFAVEESFLLSARFRPVSGPFLSTVVAEMLH